MSEKMTPEQLAARTEELKKINDQLREAGLAQEEINKQIEEQLNLEQKMANAAREKQLADREKVKVQGKINEQKQKQADLEARLLKTKQEQKQLMDDMAGDAELVQEAREAYAQDILDLEKQINDESAKGVEIQEDMDELERQAAIRRDQEKKDLQELLELREKNKDVTEETAEQTSKMANASKAMGAMGMGKFMTDAKKFMDGMKDRAGFFDKIGKTGEGFFQKGADKLSDMASKGGKFSGVIGKMGKGLGKAGTLLGKLGPLAVRMSGPFGLLVYAVARFVGLIAKLGHEVDSLSKKIAGATGFASQFHDEIIDGAIAGTMAGIQFKEMASSITSLAEGMSSFLPENEATNTSLALTVARLEKFGISGSQSVAVMDHMQRAMGLNAQQSADLTANIARMGKTVGITAKKAITDFTKAQSRLSIFGNQNIKVFKELQAQAKATGMSIDSLIGSVGKFDTFEGAAGQAASLNAVLGTTISNIEMMNATDSERINIIREQVKASVGNFDALDKFTKMHIAQAMGVKSVDEAQRLLNMSTAEYNKTLAGQQENVNVQQELADATERLIPFVDQLKLALAQIVLAFAPIVEIISKFLHFITPFITLVAKGIAGLAALAAVVALVVKAGAIMAAGLAILTNPITLVIAGVTGLLAVFGKLFDLFRSTINPQAIHAFDYLGKSIQFMLIPVNFLIDKVSKLGKYFGKFFGILREDADSLTENKTFDINGMAKIDTTKMAGGFDKVKTAIAAIAEVDMGGVIMAKPDGTTLMGGSDVIKSVADGKLQIDVKIPEQKQPLHNIIVKIGERELKKMMVDVTGEVVGAAS